MSRAETLRELADKSLAIGGRPYTVFEGTAPSDQGGIFSVKVSGFKNSETGERAAIAEIREVEPPPRLRTTTTRVVDSEHGF